MYIDICTHIYMDVHTHTYMDEILKKKEGKRIWRPVDLPQDGSVYSCSYVIDPFQKRVLPWALRRMCQIITE